MLDIDLPNTNTSVVESSVTSTPHIVSELTATTEPLIPEQETSAPSTADPTEIEVPKQLEHPSTSEPKEQSPTTANTSVDASDTKTKESRPVKGRKPDAGFAKKKAAKKPEVAKVQMNFDFDDE